MLEVFKAILIGVVEGITEWLPISSTGHMIIVDDFVSLDVSPQFLALFLVVIQLGAIGAVLVIYRQRLFPFSLRRGGSSGRRNNPDAGVSDVRSLWLKVLAASLPAAALGLLLDDWFETHLMNSLVVAVALVVYGVAFIVVERRFGGSGRLSERQSATEQGRGRHYADAGRPNNKADGIASDGATELAVPTWRQAMAIGCFQCLAIVPGTSRSGATILGGCIVGISRRSAAEFSFFLAIPVMLGWSLFKVVKALALDGLLVTNAEWLLLAVGVVTAFAVSLLVIRFLISFIQKHSFTAFGVYRIVLGIVLLALALSSGSWAV